ncbi:PAS domain-containing protein, partial [Streptomyces nojiriensis]
MARRAENSDVGWPARPDTSLALNRMGTFDWDLDSGRMYLDPTALEVMDLRPDEYDGTPGGLRSRLAPGEEARLDTRVAQAIKDRRSHYGAYVRSRRRDGAPSWTHIQGHILRDPSG